MKAIERAGYLAHARSASFQRHLARAHETIHMALTLCHHPFVAFSAGKDSSAMLYLIAEICPNMDALMLSGGESRLLYPCLDDLLAWWWERFPALRLREVLVDHVFAEGWEDATWREQFDTFQDGWNKYLHSQDNWDGVFLGLRAEESNKRRIVLRRRIPGVRYAIYRYSESRGDLQAGKFRICPLDMWTVQDVAALHALHNIPLLETYQHAGMEARTHLRTGFTAMRLGQIAELRQRDPESYRQLIARFPELARWS